MRRTVLFKTLALVLCAVSVVGWSGSTFAASPNQAPPVAAGMARIWFVRQLIPGSTFYAPTILVNGANVAISPEGTAFYRDYVPGIYKFTMANCGPNTQTWLTLTLQPSTEIALLVASNGEVAWDCQIFRLSQVQPNVVSMVFAPLRYLGQN